MEIVGLKESEEEDVRNVFPPGRQRSVQSTRPPPTPTPHPPSLTILHPPPPTPFRLSAARAWTYPGISAGYVGVSDWSLEFVTADVSGQPPPSTAETQARKYITAKQPKTQKNTHAPTASETASLGTDTICLPGAR